MELIEENCNCYETNDLSQSVSCMELAAKRLNPRMDEQAPILIALRPKLPNKDKFFRLSQEVVKVKDEIDALTDRVRDAIKSDRVDVIKDITPRIIELHSDLFDLEEIVYVSKPKDGT